mmetsp:Transcript_10950/g.20821  ORF Transcript_10950/g.20821 Transcript_10950/m.20821 type:complete len:123 (+) Transcript_10950:269-637(+)
MEPPGSSDSLSWFVAASCMDSGKTSFKDCVNKAQIPSSSFKAISQCMQNSTQADDLVAKMNSQAANNPGPAWPWVVVDGVSLPEPDMHGDNPAPLIQKVCQSFTGSPPTCCSGVDNTTSLSL